MTEDDDKQLLIGFIEWLAEQMRRDYLDDGITLNAMSEIGMDKREHLVAQYMAERKEAREWGK